MRIILIKVLYAICSPIVYMVLKIKGIKNNSLVYSSGFPYVFRGESSKIILGKRLRMLNYSWMNSIGLNHRCIITAENNAELIIGNNVGISGRLNMVF